MPRILVVDDHPMYREGMMSALGKELPDATVAGAGSAEEGLEMLRRAPDTALVLMDLRLPGMDGLAALALYGESHPDVPCMVVSASDDPDLVKRAFDAGASGFIAKSMTLAEVGDAVRKVLGGGVFVREEAPPPAANGGTLTLRQLEVLRLLGEGYTNREIAQTLQIAEGTAKAHIAAIFEALEADNRTQAVVAAQRRGLLPTSSKR
jgi:DNA-binding NarL/FixJ family response regulator